LHSTNRYTDQTDEQLLQAYRASGDNEWLGHLLKRYTTLLLGVALKYLKDKSLAEDAVQQIFIKVLTHMPSEQITNFKGWLYILMRNHCFQQLRDKTRFADEEAIANLPYTDADKEDIQWHEQTLQQLDEAVALLNEDQRTAITLFYLKKYSYEQIIGLTGHTFMQVKSHIQNGKRNLKAILLKRQGNNRS